MSAAVLQGQRLTRRFGDVEAVRDITIALSRGESVALLGTSGCGKTTLLQMLGLLDRPTEGTVLVEGVNPWTLSAGARARLRRDRIGFVFQVHNLLGYLTARENVALPAWHRGGSRRRALTRSDELLERFGLSPRGGARAAVLSPGEAQRVAVARAVVNRPPIILADEPTGNLDSSSAGPVLDALFGACRGAEPAALLVVTHDPEVARRSDRAVRIADGRVTDADQ